MLTPREFQIANKLLSVQSGLRVKDLAEEFRVSARTIQYDLENVKGFLQQQGVSFCSSPGKGMWVEGAEQLREDALAELSRLQRSSAYCTQEMRTQRILLQLVFSEGYVTAGALAEELNMSRGTILSDMDQISTFLQDSGMRLTRKVRRGYQLDGREITLRTLAEKLLQEGMPVYDIYRMISRLNAGEPSGVFALRLPDAALRDYRVIESALIPAFAHHPARLQEENIVLLMARLLISVSRIRMGCFVGDPVLPAQKNLHFLYPYWAEAYRQSGLPVLKDELDYILGRYQAGRPPVDVAALSADLVESVSRTEDFPYYEDSTLYPRLLSHLHRYLSDQNKDTVRNPFHSLILESHDHLYKSIQAVCKKHIDNSYLYSNDSLISYLVLYFLAAQRNLGVGRKLRVLFVCTTGRGAAKIIARMLETEIPRIEVVQHCSLAEAGEAEKTLKPDFMISAFPIEAAVPVVVVEPLPTKANIEAVRKLIAELGGGDLLPHSRLIDYRMGDDRQDEVSQEVVLVGLKIYAKLCEQKNHGVKQEMEFAFLAHVMLLAGRYVLDKQFSSKATEWTGLDLFIRGVLEEIGVYLSLDEIKALAYYFDCDDPSGKTGHI